jgi:hypothetical protein
MDDIDFSGYTDEELATLAGDIAALQAQRNRVSKAPDDLRMIAQQYLSDGGNLATLQATLGELDG